MKPIHHIIFWTAIMLILTLAFGSSWGSYLESFYFVSMLLPVVAGTSYFFNYYLVPRYLFQGRYGYFVLYLFYTLVFSLYLEMVVLMVSFMYLANFNIYEMGPHASDALLLAIILYLVVLATSFILAVRQLMHNQRKVKEMQEELERGQIRFLVVRADRMNRQVDPATVVYIESLSDYLKLHLEEGAPVVTREKISHILQRLPHGFARIHRSFIVNTDKVHSYDREEVRVGRVTLPVGRVYRADALERLSVSTQR